MMLRFLGALLLLWGVTLLLGNFGLFAASFAHLWAMALLALAFALLPRFRANAGEVGDGRQHG